MKLNISFAYDDGRIVEIEDVTKIEVMDYIFNGALHARSALIVGNMAYDLRLVADIRLSVHKG